MVQKKRVAMDPVAKGKIDPAVVKKAVHEVIPSPNNLSTIIQKFQLLLHKNTSKYLDIPQYFHFGSLEIFEFFVEELFGDGIKNSVSHEKPWRVLLKKPWWNI
ncbi:MAG: hypothetical protein HZB10_01265 [Candidatus Yonathbacteria bacterium]|nr:hypothetical protein [Candidatus Yonathbacteria bacterium]